MQTINAKTAEQVRRSSSTNPAWKILLSDMRFLLPLLFFCALSALLYTTIACAWPKFSRAEVFFAECAREMANGANWVTPLYHGKPFFDKPILIYWLILLSFKCGGTSHLTARIPSIIAAVLTVASTGTATALLSGRRAGLLAAMAAGSSFMFFSFAALCMSDMMLTLFDTLTLSFLYVGLVREESRKRFWWLASVTMGLAFLTKGPVGLVLPALAFLLYLALTKRLTLIRPAHLLLGAVTAAVIASPWFIAAWQVNGPESMRYFFLHENLERFAGSTYDTHRPFWFMISSFLTGFAPWSVFMPLVFLGSFRSIRAGLSSESTRTELFLWVWIAVVLLFFSASRGKIDYYALPAYPAAAALCGIYLSRWMDGQARIITTAGWGLSFCFIVASVISAVFLPKITGETAIIQWLLTPAALLLTGLLMILCMRHKKPFQAFCLVFAGVITAAIGFSLQIMPSIVSLQPVLTYIPVIGTSPANTTIGVWKSIESWVDEITFQTGREPVHVADQTAMCALLEKHEPVLLVVPADVFADIPPSLMSRLRILDSRPFIAHSINPGFAFKRYGKLSSNVPLLLVSNRPD